MKEKQMRLLPLCFALLVCAAPATAQTLVGVARIPSNARDQFGETLGGFGSAMALAPGSWRHNGTHYTGALTMLPDRGWNTQGTTDYRARLQHFTVTLTPYTGQQPAGQIGLTLAYRSSPLLRDAAGAPTTGLDPARSVPPRRGFPNCRLAPTANSALTAKGWCCRATAAPG